MRFSKTKIGRAYSRALKTGEDKDLLALFSLICRENTGSALCDSGSAYGYIYNSPIPANALDVENLNISTVHHLAQCCIVDETSARLDRDFRYFAYRKENRDECWLGNLEGFLAERADIGFDGYLSSSKVSNSYNWDNDLDQVLQFVIFNLADDEHKVYLAVQVHTGCDVRSGYTRPYFFKLDCGGEIAYFFDMKVTGSVDDGEEEFESAYQISEAAEFKPEANDGAGGWFLPDGREVWLSCTAEGF